MLTMLSMFTVHLTVLYVSMWVLVAVGHQQQVLAAPLPRPTTTATCQGVPAEQRATIVYGVMASATKFEARSMQHIRQWWTDSTRGAGEALAPGWGSSAQCRGSSGWELQGAWEDCLLYTLSMQHASACNARVRESNQLWWSTCATYSPPQTPLTPRSRCTVTPTHHLTMSNDCLCRPIQCT